MKALVLGATGLVGGSLLSELLKDSTFTSVDIIVRKKIENSNPKLTQIISDFRSINELQLISGDVLFICIGTTIKKAGSKDAFKRVDLDIPLEISKIAKHNNFSKVCLVSSMGANANSNIFYSKIKGQLEEALKKLNFSTLGIFQPSMLLGNRTEHRFGEQIGKVFMKTFEFLIPAQYKAIEAEKVAISMVEFSKSNSSGVQVFTSDKI